jgi:hypothetical protein
MSHRIEKRIESPAVTRPILSQYLKSHSLE